MPSEPRKFQQDLVKSVKQMRRGQAARVTKAELPTTAEARAHTGMSQQEFGHYASVATQPVVFQVKVKPNARVSALTQADDGTWLAQIKAGPIDGRANEELIALIASHFHCRKSAVSIKSGASGRMKLVRVEKYNISS